MNVLKIRSMGVAHPTATFGFIPDTIPLYIHLIQSWVDPSKQ
jgi:hypothetical protein